MATFDGEVLDRYEFRDSQGLGVMKMDAGHRIGMNPATLLWVLSLCAVAAAQERSSDVAFRHEAGAVVVHVDGRPIATYVYDDPKIPRPFFAHVKAPNGLQVTRNHPPVPGEDSADHDTMHPGIWMAFGDLDGSDFWRNAAGVVHVRFASKPSDGKGLGTFAEEKQYLRADGTVVCREMFRCSLHVRPGGYLMTWDSTFSSDNTFYFGDQEEMGLGLRVATPFCELNGGRLSDSERRTGASDIWSNAARWCDYSGTTHGQPIGLTLMCHPENFRPSWMHARNYGLVAANAFGRQAMHKGEPSKVIVRPGETLRLRYGVWIHSGEGPTIDAAYRDYVAMSGIHAVE